MNIFFISLGCDKNLADSEVMLGMIRDAGYEIVSEEDIADIIIINTCCFIHDAKEESITTILEIAKLKENGRLKGLIVTGCLAERYREEILEEIPEVDIIIGTTAYDEIVNAIGSIIKKDKTSFFKSKDYLPVVNTKRIVTTGSCFGYLKIAEGCDKHCTYCIIPELRGSYRSIRMERLLEDARNMAESGVKEIILVAQETTIYGTDLYGEKQLHILLKELCKIEEIKWIRILYCYPEEIYDELIETIACEEKICKYLDLPVQHASDNILKKMGRRTTQQELTNIISKLRSRIPEIIIRTSLISGFPGESEEDHECLLQFVKNSRFDRLGVFTYSKEENTPAARMHGQIPKRLKEKRRKEIMLLQQRIAFEKAAERQNTRMKAIIDGFLPEENMYVGRTYMDTPGIDGMVFINTDEDLMSGDIIDIKITASHDYDLIANKLR